MKSSYLHINKNNLMLQVLILLSMAIIAGLGTNCIRSAPLALVQDWSVKARLTTADGDTMALDLDQAIPLYKNRQATFVDARDASNFHKGHIKGALNLPWHDVQEQFMAVAPRLDPELLIITYCDGESCALSHDLAFFLKEMGFNVKVMTGGWDAWTKANMPVTPEEKGNLDG
jgi:rhodanese-related sulfurtransferase